MAKSVSMNLAKDAGVAMKKLHSKLKKLDGRTESPESDPKQAQNLTRAIASLGQSTKDLQVLCRQTWRAKFTVNDSKKRSTAKHGARTAGSGRARRSRATR